MIKSLRNDVLSIPED
jgi:ubiquitin carboxyl-terminal hydrolase 9/24